MSSNKPMKTTNILAIIDKAIKENGIARRIANLPYPFMRALPKIRLQRWRDELQEINQLAHDTFSPGESLGGITELMKWQKASPNSWLVCEINNEICGYIHIEPIIGSRGDAICTGVSHEGEITPEDILKPKELGENDYIHIGSIVSKPLLPKKLDSHVGMQLISGITDRVIELQSKGKGVHRILAVDYPDAQGKHHARNILIRYGFKHEVNWVTSENPPNDVYILDLNSPLTTAVQKLIKAVKIRKAKYRFEQSRRQGRLLRALVVVLFLSVATLLLLAQWLPATLIAIVTVIDIVWSIARNVEDEVSKLLS